VQKDLWAAYHATRFEAETPFGKASISTNKAHPDLDAIVERHGCASWCFITASNPGSRALDTSRNEDRNRSLRSDLYAEGAGPVFPGLGVPGDSGWTPEASFLALGVARDRAIELGRRYGQNAVVWGRLRERAELLDCRESSAEEQP
jgi:hypothetical protein